MFIGHFAVGLAAKGAAPQVSLGWLIAGAQFVDLLWPVFVLTGLEQVRIDPGNTAFTPLDFVSYPITHSLAGGCLWAVLFAGAYWLRSRDRSGAQILAACVLSHWVLDVLTHRPDMPVLFSGGKIGLGLWNHFAATMIVELCMFAAGVWICSRIIQRRALWIFAFVLLLIYLANAFGPPPPSVTALGWVGLGLWIFPAWAWWIDRPPVPK